MGMGIRFDEGVVKTIVHAINRAITVDIPVAFGEYQRATNNCFPAMRVDIINDNIFNLVQFDGVLIHRFKRRGWKVCMIIDNNAKNAYFIFSEKNLKSIPAKIGRTWPHYLQSLLHEFHRGYEGKAVQQTLFPMELFDDETYEKDVETILGNLIDDLEPWNLYVVAHEHNGKEVTSIKQYFLSPQFDVIDEKDLSEYIIPDYSAVVNPVGENTTTQSEPENAEELVKIKSKARPVSESDANPKVKPNEYDNVV